MTEQQLEQLLGRPLSSTEQANLDLYVEIARQRLEYLLCFKLDVKDVGSPGESPAEAEQRVYDSRDGYRTLYIDPFTSISEVKIDDKIVTNYTIKDQSLVFDKVMSDSEVKITADWGFDALPSPLALLLAKLFSLVAKEQKSNRVKTKSIEGYSVTYADTTEYQQYVLDNAALINQYRQCGEVIDHGRISRFRY